MSGNIRRRGRQHVDEGSQLRKPLLAEAQEEDEQLGEDLWYGSERRVSSKEYHRSGSFLTTNLTGLD
jgi:hypothetical protein